MKKNTCISQVQIYLVAILGLLAPTIAFAGDLDGWMPESDRVRVPRNIYYAASDIVAEDKAQLEFYRRYGIPLPSAREQGAQEPPNSVAESHLPGDLSTHSRILRRLQELVPDSNGRHRPLTFADILVLSEVTLAKSARDISVSLGAVIDGSDIEIEQKKVIEELSAMEADPALSGGQSLLLFLRQNRDFIFEAYNGGNATARKSRAMLVMEANGSAIDPLTISPLVSFWSKWNLWQETMEEASRHGDNTADFVYEILERVGGRSELLDGSPGGMTRFKNAAVTIFEANIRRKSHSDGLGGNFGPILDSCEPPSGLGSAAANTNAMLRYQACLRSNREAMRQAEQERNERERSAAVERDSQSRDVAQYNDAIINRYRECYKTEHSGSGFLDCVARIRTDALDAIEAEIDSIENCSEYTEDADILRCREERLYRLVNRR